MSKIALTDHRFAKNFLHVVINKLKTNFLNVACCASVVIATFGIKHVFAQAPARPDKIMTIAELRTCMKLAQSNKKAAEEILQEQEAFKRDQDAVKMEQAAVTKANDEIGMTAGTISAERDALSRLGSALSAKASDAKTDEQKVAVEAERVTLAERDRAYRQNVERFSATQQVQGDRVNALNERIGAINQRNQTVNNRVEPHQKQAALWRVQCSNRRFREEDEIVIKKEMAAGK